MKKIFETPFFTQESIPNWPCPECGDGHLVPVQDSFQCYGDANTARNGEHIDAEDHKYVFTLIGSCNNCKENVAVSGKGGLERAPLGDGQWEITDYFIPTFFEPSLQIIDVSTNKNLPTTIKNSINKSFALFWSDFDACANRIRSTLELLLDDMGVTRENPSASSGYLSLHDRIKKIDVTSKKSRDIKDLVMALKWLGNTASHGLEGILHEQLIDGYKMMEKILELQYPSIDHDIQRLLAKAKAVNRGRKWNSGL